METQSNNQLPEFEYLGNTLRINFNEKFVEKEDMTYYQYKTAVISKSASLDERIEAIIATEYPTYGAELAAKNGSAVEVYKHNETVAKAKWLARKSLGLVEGDFTFVPPSITPRQAKLQLALLGKLDSVKPIIDALPEPECNVAEVEWETATRFDRDSIFIKQFAELLEIDADNFFIEAAKL